MGMQSRYAAAGIVAAQLLPWAIFPSGVVHVRAAWCWGVKAGTKPATCLTPVVTDGSCKEGNLLDAGTSCTPQCAAGKVPVGACSVVCPVSEDPPQCLKDLSAATWWDLCGPGETCIAPMQLGAGEWKQFGDFKCVDANSPEASASCASVEVAAVEDIVLKMDQYTVGLIVALVVVALVGAVAGRASPKAVDRLLFWPGPMLWSPANIAGVLVVLAGLIVLGSVNGRTLGAAAGVAAMLTVAWSFFKGGADKLLGMTREAAWRVHIVMGSFMMIFGLVHGVYMLVDYEVFNNVGWTLGLVGLVLVWLGVMPQSAVQFGLLSYDKFKLFHMVSVAGYLLLIVHMLDHARLLQTAAAIAVAAGNVAVLAAFMVQKGYVKLSASKASVELAEVSSESSGKHVWLHLNAPGFAFKAGQWGHLSIPSLSLVPHPFTLVPGDEPGKVKIFMRVTGKFTSGVAAAAQKGAAAMPSVKLEGPYGIPSVPSSSVDAAVFIFGGVGITPALSLAAEASKFHGVKVPIYWGLRSLELLKRCAPMLEPHMDKELSTVVLNGQDVQAGGNALPLNARYGHEDVHSWLAEVSKRLSEKGVHRVMLFVCGPPGLAAAAKAAAGSKECNASVAWHLHVEEFLFLPPLPKMPKCGSRKRTAVSAATKPTLLGSQPTA